MQESSINLRIIQVTYRGAKNNKHTFDDTCFAIKAHSLKHSS